MDWIGTTPAAAVLEPVRLLLEKAVEQGNPAPRGLVFFDPEGHWRNVAAGLGLADRKACVAVGLDHEDMLAAARLFIGGGLVLPPSTTRVSAACRAAHVASESADWKAEPVAVAEMARCDSRLQVSLWPQEIWSDLVGLRGRLEVLTALATAVDRPAVIGSGTTLIVTGVVRSDVERAWERLDVRPLWTAGNRCLVIEGASPESVSDTDTRGFVAEEMPVAQWPSGRIVGRWSVEVSKPDCPWQLRDESGKCMVVAPVTTPAHLDQAATEVFRVDGIPASDLERAGSPGAIAVEGLAREADRIGAKLWVPNVSPVAGAVIRRWGVPVWVDGSSLSD